MSFDLNENNSINRQRDGFIAEINMTPFVDVCLVLLIIFMVTAPFAVSGINVQLPKTQAKSLTLSNESLILSITKKGSYFIKKTQVKDDDLVSKIKDEITNEEHPSIFIRADEGVRYGNVMFAMAAAQKAGIEKIGMIGENKYDRK